MNINDQVCSLELAQKLFTLGVNNKSIFGWIYHQHSDAQEWACKHHEPNRAWYVIRGTNDHKPITWGNKDKEVAAYTSAELGELIPNCILKPDLAPFDNYRLTIRKFISVDEKMNQTNNFIINYECDSTEMSGEEAWLTRKLSMNIYDPNLANAFAKMLIYLIENKLMELPI